MALTHSRRHSLVSFHRPGTVPRFLAWSSSQAPAPAPLTRGPFVTGLDPDNASALRGRGSALGGLGRNEEVLREFHKSLELDHDNGETLMARALAHAILENGEREIGD